MLDWAKDTDVFEGYGRPCPICGALVPVPRQEQHERWHNQDVPTWPTCQHGFIPETCTECN